jgi:hypothetical protein
MARIGDGADLLFASEIHWLVRMYVIINLNLSLTCFGFYYAVIYMCVCQYTIALECSTHTSPSLIVTAAIDVTIVIFLCYSSLLTVSIGVK